MPLYCCLKSSPHLPSSTNSSVSKVASSVLHWIDKHAEEDLCTLIRTALLVLLKPELPSYKPQRTLALIAYTLRIQKLPITIIKQDVRLLVKALRRSIGDGFPREGTRDVMKVRQ